MRPMSAEPVRLHRWDEIALEKVTEMLSRKIVAGEREMLAQVYLKRGCLVPMHSHESEQLTYILEGALKFLFTPDEKLQRALQDVRHLVALVRMHRHEAAALQVHLRENLPSAGDEFARQHFRDFFERNFVPSMQPHGLGAHAHEDIPSSADAI